MKTANAVLNTLRKDPSLFQRYGIRRLALFGSVAKGNAGLTSDVDLLVDFSEGQVSKRYFSLWDELETVLDAKVDLVLSRSLKPSLRSIINLELIDVTPD